MMCKFMSFLPFLFAVMSLLGQNMKPKVEVQQIDYAYQDQDVSARKLTVISHIPIDRELAWANVQTPALLQYVAKGIFQFRAAEGMLPHTWQEGQTYGVKMRLFGLFPIGGTHYLYIETVDESSGRISTREWDEKIHVWNHEILIKEQPNGTIYYEDRITIYAGSMTGLVTRFAKQFYLHRQRRWQKVARKQLDFSPS
ncbi:MAG: hypothetical protein AAGM67_03590 [Bacteroidota bacterium]